MYKIEYHVIRVCLTRRKDDRALFNLGAFDSYHFAIVEIEKQEKNDLVYYRIEERITR